MNARRGVRAVCSALLATFAAGCTTPPAPSSTVTAPSSAVTAPNAAAPNSTATASSAAAPSAPAAAPVAVAVTLTGLVTRAADGALEICAGESVRPCPGVRVRSELQPELVSTRERPLVVRLAGTYDGGELVLSKAELVGAPARRAPQVHCEAPLRSTREQSKGRARADELERRYPERFAGLWWDRERSLYTVWLTGDVADVERPALREGVCVVGGARFSARELSAAFERAQQVLGESGVLLVEGGTDVLTNRVQLRVEHIDRTTLSRVHAVAGDAAALVSFIELTERPLSELPPPPARGDVPLVTSPLRSSTAMMHALGHFAVRLDEARRCVYLEAQNGERLLPLWPFGYAALTGPLRIVDYDDVEVAREGAPTAFGGGHVPISPELRDYACGAESAWSGAPSGR